MIRMDIQSDNLKKYEQMKNIKFLKITIIIFVLFSIVFQTKLAFAEDLKLITDLKGSWKFSIGDNPEWSKPEFNDQKWDNVIVPKSWEGNGFENYNGFAWYRKEFTVYEHINEKFVSLQLGYIDDADEVYINGKLVGSSGKFPPNVSSAYNMMRKYSIPVDLLNINSTNTIVVRVYDFYDNGGIVSGSIGLYIDRESKLLAVNLAGYWDFETEAMMKKRMAENGVKSANKIFVPSYWEANGYNYDGKARYVTEFKIPNELIDKELYLILGFIDDVETVYINKQKIGSVFSLEEEEDTGLPYHKIFRGYLIPNEVLIKNGLNKLSVMVFDKGGEGGIYEGPVGITTKENYNTLKRINANKKSGYKLFFDSFNF